MTKIRCPVCGGCGGVEPSFGVCGTSSTDASLKTCPACHGTGMQETEPKEGWYGGKYDLQNDK